jgi:hypothetical protein
MAKPIFLIGFPLHAENSAIHIVQADLSKKLEGEYHVLTYKVPGLDSIKFEVLNAINASDIDIEELIEKTRQSANDILEDYHSKFTNLLNQSLHKDDKIKNNQNEDGKI